MKKEIILQGRMLWRYIIIILRARILRSIRQNWGRRRTRTQKRMRTIIQSITVTQQSLSTFRWAVTGTNACTCQQVINIRGWITATSKQGRSTPFPQRLR